jgi:hypothetical protein
MPALPPLRSFALLAEPGFFFGLAFEEFYSTSAHRHGGIRTFPLLALAGGLLYLLDTLVPARKPALALLALAALGVAIAVLVGGG